MCQIGLCNIGMVVNQPKHRYLFLREVEMREGLREVPVDGPVSQPDVKPDDIADFADILVARDVRRGDCQRLFLPYHPIPLL